MHSRNWIKPCVTPAKVLLFFGFAWGPVKHRFFDEPLVAPNPKVAGPAAVVETDPLCQYVVGIGMKCVLAPSEEGLMGPGHYVKYTPEDNNSARVLRIHFCHTVRGA